MFIGKNTWNPDMPPPAVQMSTGVSRVLVLLCLVLVQFGLCYLGSMLILNKTEEL